MLHGLLLTLGFSMGFWAFNIAQKEVFVFLAVLFVDCRDLLRLKKLEALKPVDSCLHAFVAIFKNNIY